jgi:hypothetical protein
MNAAAPKSNTQNITPAVHLEFIQNQLENPADSASEEIEGYHRSLFLHHHAVEWETYRQQARTHEDKLAFLQSRLKDTELRLTERPKLIPVMVDGQEDVQPTSAWNFWDRSMFVICALGILCLITFGVLNISFNLLESGFVTFRENPFRSYLWAALLPVGALAVKVGWDCLTESRQRAMYLWVCLGVGMLGVLTWVGAYACVYPTLSKGINEQIASLTVFDGSAGSGSHVNFAGAKWVDVITVGGQAVAEVFLSAVLGMYLTSLYSRHRPVRLAEDPAFSQLDQERRRLEEEISRERIRFGEASGHLIRLENQLAALVAYGKSMFHKEAAKRQDQSEKRKVILDQLSDHLRNHLEAAEPTNRLAAAASGAPLGRKNGD